MKTQLLIRCFAMDISSFLRSKQSINNHQGRQFKFVEIVCKVRFVSSRDGWAVTLNRIAGYLYKSDSQKLFKHCFRKVKVFKNSRGNSAWISFRQIIQHLGVQFKLSFSKKFLVAWYEQNVTKAEQIFCRFQKTNLHMLKRIERHR